MRSAIRFYRAGISPLTPPACRFVPSCSAYALEALERHGTVRGCWLTLRRLARCHPLGGRGFDPVPRPLANGDAQAPRARGGRGLAGIRSARGGADARLSIPGKGR